MNKYVKFGIKHKKQMEQVDLHLSEVKSGLYKLKLILNRIK